MKSRSMRIAVIGQGDPGGHFTARPAAKRTVLRICKARHGNTRKSMRLAARECRCKNYVDWPRISQVSI